VRVQVTEAPETPEQMKARFKEEAKEEAKKEAKEELLKEMQAAGGASAVVSVSLTLCC
jgi:hypothetical protein